MRVTKNNMLAKFLPSFSDEKSKNEMPLLQEAHLADENGLPIAHDNQIASPPIKVIETLLKHQEGVVIGRLKRSFSDVEFLSENMSYLQRMGVTKFFCNFIEADDQYLLDRYFNGAAIADDIRDYIHKKYSKEQKGIELSTRVELYLRVLRNARNYDIRIIGIGVPPYVSDDVDPDEFMASVIMQFNNYIPGKSIVCSGALT